MDDSGMEEGFKEGKEREVLTNEDIWNGILIVFV